MVFSVSSSFHHQYNWNIFERGAKHHQTIKQANSETLIYNTIKKIRFIPDG
jgi:hypothetical protein